MKKYLAVLLGVLFILSFSATAFAIHEEMPPEEAVVTQGPAKITLGGKLIFRGWYFHNVDELALPAHPTIGSRSEAIYTTNAYLTVDAKISDNIRGFMELETSNNGSNNSGVLYWGGGAHGTYDTKPNGDLRFRQVWMQYTGSGLFGIPAGIKVGHMPIALGEKIFLNNERFGDDAILAWVDPTKEMHLLAGTVKLVDNSNVNIGFINHTNDLDGYVLLFTYAWDKDNVIGANWTWAHSDGNLPSSPIAVPNVDTLNFHNIGVHAHGKLGGLTYAAEGDFQLGKARGIAGVDEFDEPTETDGKFQGYGLFAKVGYMLDPVNLRASFALGSGDNSADDEKVKEFQTLQGTDATGAIARFVHYTFIYERLVRTAALESVVTTNPGGNTRSTGIANTTAYNLGFDVNPLKDLSISVDGWYLRATNVGGWEDVSGHSVSKNVGWEIDGSINYKIAKNLTYFVQAGLFKPGGFYRDAALKTQTDPDTGEVTVVPFDRKTVQMAVHGLLLEF